MNCQIGVGLICLTSELLSINEQSEKIVILRYSIWLL